MAASVTATSVLPVPPKPEPTVITPDFSDGSRMAAILWRRHSATASAAASRLARSRLPEVSTSLCLSACLDTAPLTPSRADAGSSREGGEGMAQAALSLPGNSVHHPPGSSGYWVIASSQVRYRPRTNKVPSAGSRVAGAERVSCSFFRAHPGTRDLDALGVVSPYLA